MKYVQIVNLVGVILISNYTFISLFLISIQSVNSAKLIVTYKTCYCMNTMNGRFYLLIFNFLVENFYTAKKVSRNVFNYMSLFVLLIVFIYVFSFGNFLV